MLVEYARNILKLPRSHTTEIDSDATHPVIDVMPGQKELMAKGEYGGTMRLGSYPAHLKPGTIAYEAYSQSASSKLKAQSSKLIHERHRHRYEVNPKYVKKFEEGGIVFSGVSPSGILMEIAELPRAVHPFMLGTQFHPELQTFLVS